MYVREARICKCCLISIVITLIFLVKGHIQMIIFLYYLLKNIHCWYLLESFHCGTSNEYSQYIFSWKNKKIFFS